MSIDGNYDLNIKTTLYTLLLQYHLQKLYKYSTIGFSRHENGKGCPLRALYSISKQHSAEIRSKFGPKFLLEKITIAASEII